jgi:hypothetical protein
MVYGLPCVAVTAIRLIEKFHHCMTPRWTTSPVVVTLSHCNPINFSNNLSKYNLRNIYFRLKYVSPSGIIPHSQTKYSVCTSISSFPLPIMFFSIFSHILYVRTHLMCILLWSAICVISAYSYTFELSSLGSQQTWKPFHGKYASI